MSDGWFYEAEGRIVGPVSGSRLKELARSRAISLETPVKHGTDGKWVRAGQLQLLCAGQGTAGSTGSRGPQLDDDEVVEWVGGPVPTPRRETSDEVPKRTKPAQSKSISAISHGKENLGAPRSKHRSKRVSRVCGCAFVLCGIGFVVCAAFRLKPGQPLDVVPPPSSLPVGSRDAQVYRRGITLDKYKRKLIAAPVKRLRLNIEPRPYYSIKHHWGYLRAHTSVTGGVRCRVVSTEVDGKRGKWWGDQIEVGTAPGDSFLSNLTEFVPEMSVCIDINEDDERLPGKTIGAKSTVDIVYAQYPTRPVSALNFVNHEDSVVCDYEVLFVSEQDIKDISRWQRKSAFIKWHNTGVKVDSRVDARTKRIRFGVFVGLGVFILVIGILMLRGYHRDIHLWSHKEPRSRRSDALRSREQ